MPAPTTHETRSERWPQLEELVPPDLPPEVAVARLVALAQSLLIENRRLRELVQRSYREDETDVLDPPHTTDGGVAA